MIVQTITYHDWKNWLAEEGYNGFSEEGAKVLFDYLEQLSKVYLENGSEPMEYEPQYWCLSYKEYKNIEDYNKKHKTDYTLDELKNKMTVIQFTNGFIA